MTTLTTPRALDLLAAVAAAGGRRFADHGRWALPAAGELLEVTVTGLAITLTRSGAAGTAVLAADVLDDAGHALFSAFHALPQTSAEDLYTLFG